MEHENEYVAAARYPRLPLVIEGLEYPENIQALIDDTNAAFDRWAEAETDFMSAEQDLIESKAKDAKAFKDSVLNGSKDPGDTHAPKAAREVERTAILLAARLSDVNRAGAKVSEAYKAQGKEIVTATVAMARNGLENQERLVRQAADLLADASRAREKGLSALVLASELTKSAFRFHPYFPQRTQVVLPNLNELPVKGLLENLDNVLKKGVLFPDPKE